MDGDHHAFRTAIRGGDGRSRPVAPYGQRWGRVPVARRPVQDFEDAHRPEDIQKVDRPGGPKVCVEGAHRRSGHESGWRIINHDPLDPGAPGPARVTRRQPLGPDLSKVVAARQVAPDDRPSNVDGLRVVDPFAFATSQGGQGVLPVSIAATGRRDQPPRLEWLNGPRRSFVPCGQRFIKVPRPSAGESGATGRAFPGPPWQTLGLRVRVVDQRGRVGLSLLARPRSRNWQFFGLSWADPHR